MNKKFLRRLATVATVATVGGLLPLALPAAAFAAEPTAVAVSPSVGHATGNGSTAFAVTLDTLGSTGKVYYWVTSGPDASPNTNPNIHPCDDPVAPAPASTYTCLVAHSGTPGIDALTFFYDASSTGVYSNSAPSVSGSLAVSGAVSKITLAPTASSVAQGGYQSYLAVATDAAGRPVVGQNIRVTASEPNTLSGQLTVTGTKPTVGATVSKHPAQAVTIPVTPDGVSAPATISTGDGTAAGTVPGGAMVYVASGVSGAVTVTARKQPALGSPVTVTSTLTVNPARLADATSLTIAPATQTSFTSGTVTELVTVTNAQGNPVAGVTPVVTVTSGPNLNLVASAGTTDGTGTATVTYPAGIAPGTDALEAVLARPSGTDLTATAAVTLIADHVELVAQDPTTVSLSTTSVPVTFTVKGVDPSVSPAGYLVNFSVVAPLTLDQSSAVSDANGKVTVLVNNASPVQGQTGVVTASFAAGAAGVGNTIDATVNWAATVRQATIVIAPFAGTSATKGSTNFTVSATDQFGVPITSGITYTWTVTTTGVARNTAVNNPSAHGTGTTFSYTDVGNAVLAGSDLVTVTATSPIATYSGNDSVVQYWTTGTSKAAQSNIDLGPNGVYTAFGVNGPFVADQFTKSINAGVSANPTTAVPTTTVTQVQIKPIDANGNPTFGKAVTVTSSGVGVFTDSLGKPLAGNTTTAIVASAGTSAGEDAYFGTEPRTVGEATVFVRSTSTGKQTLTATVDGITDTAVINYAGQYVAVAPTRVLDTRTGQGALSTATLGSAPAGPIAKNTVYSFYFGATSMPLDASAYAFNVTAVSPNAIGNLRIGENCGFFGGAQVPTSSLINYQPGKDIANFVIVPNNRQCNGLSVYSDNANTNVAIDLVGYYNANSDVKATTGSPRVVDTRSNLGTTGGAVAAGSTRSFQIAGTAGIPVGTKSVAVTVTAIAPLGGGNLRVFPNGVATPTASSINYIPGVDKAATVIVALPANGKLDVFSDGSPAGVAIDVVAYFDSSNNQVVNAPVRVLDTRTGTSLASNTPVNLTVVGVAGVPSTAQAVLVSLTGIHTAGSTGVGNLRAYPAGGALPEVSTLNYFSSTTDVANFAIVPVGANGQITLYSNGSSIDVAVDVVGFIPAGS